MASSLAASLVPSAVPKLATAPVDPGRYRFGEFVLYPRQRQLWRNGLSIPLTPRTLDLLLVFLRNPGVVLRREDLFQWVWGPISVQDNSLTVHLCLLRRALGGENRLILTIPGRGYQFAAPVIAESVIEGLPQLASGEAGTAPWVTIRPFRRLGPSRHYPALGAALIPVMESALAQLSSLRIRSRPAAGRLGTDWSLEGSYQELQPSVRVTAKLVRMADGGVGWASQRDFPASGNFAMQDLIAQWLAPEVAAAVGRV